MTTKRKIITAIVAVALIPVLIMAFVALPWIILGVGILLSPNPPKPEITYGEFPFEIVYEIDGKQITVQDTYICEFDGFGANEGVGKYRSWKGYVKSTGEEHMLMLEDNNTVIYCYVGKAEYYMNDEERYYGVYPITPHLYGVSKTDDLYYNSMYPDEILEYYKIKIISWEFSEPITNTFK